MRSQDPYKDAARGVSSDMSPEAVARRLEIASHMSAVAMELAKAGKTFRPHVPKQKRVEREDESVRRPDCT